MLKLYLSLSISFSNYIQSIIEEPLTGWHTHTASCYGSPQRTPLSVGLRHRNPVHEFFLLSCLLTDLLLHPLVLSFPLYVILIRPFLLCLSSAPLMTDISVSSLTCILQSLARHYVSVMAEHLHVADSVNRALDFKGHEHAMRGRGAV